MSPNPNPSTITEELQAFHSSIEGMLGRFSNNRDGIHMHTDDIPRYKQLIIELQDYLKDHVPDNAYRHTIHARYRNGMNNFTMTPSHASVTDIAGTIAAIITRIERNPAFLNSSPESTEAPPLEYPGDDKITITWLTKHLPVRIWLSLLVLLVGAFALGFKIGPLFTLQ